MRATIGWFRGISVGIVSNNRVRAAVTIVYCGTGTIVKASLDSYLEHSHSLKMIPNRLSFEQYRFVTMDRYLMLKAIRLQWYRSMPIGQLNTQGYLSIPIAQTNRCVRVCRSTPIGQLGLHGCRLIPITAQLNRFAIVSELFM